MFIELIEVVEDIKELFLGFFLIDDELEIVDNEDVEFAEFEVEFFAFAKFDGVDEIGIKVGNGGVEDFEGGIFSKKLVADGLDEVGLAEAGATIEEEGIIAVAGGVDDTASGGDGEVVVGADDEIVESVFLVEAGFVGGGVFGGLTDGFDAVFDYGVAFGDFAGADFRFGAMLDFEIDVDNVEIVVLEGGSDEIEITIAELLDVERVFDTDFDVAVGGRNKGSVLEPGGEISS